MPLSSYIISHWKMDEAGGANNAVDSVGTNTGVQAASPGSAAGKISTCRDLELSLGQHFAVANNASMDVAGVTFGYTGWWQMESKAATMHMCGKRGAGQLEHWLRYDSGTDRFQFRVYATPSGVSTEVEANALGSPAITTWYFIACWKDHVGQTINIQVNNGTVNSTAFAAAVTDGTSAFEIGAGAGAEFWDGLVDELTFWKGGFPTAAERTQIYNGGAGVDLATLLAIGSATNDWTSPMRTLDRTADSTPHDRLRILRESRRL